MAFNPVNLPTREEFQMARRDGEKRSQWYADHREELERLYPDEVVVVVFGEVIDHDHNPLALAIRLLDHPAIKTLPKLPRGKDYWMIHVRVAPVSCPHIL